MSSLSSTRNVYFHDGWGKIVGGFFQNGSVTWNELQKYMHIVYLNQSTSYAVYICVEPLDMKNLPNNHGPRVAIDAKIVATGHYVLLGIDGLLALSLFVKLLADNINRRSAGYICHSRTRSTALCIVFIVWRRSQSMLDSCSVSGLVTLWLIAELDHHLPAACA